MNGSRISALCVGLAAIFWFKLAAIAQTRPDATVTSASPGAFPAWAYPWDPKAEYRRARTGCTACRAAQRLSASRRHAMSSSRQTGILVTIHPCRRSLLAAGSPTCALVAPVTVPKALAVLRTRAWPGYPPPMSHSRSLTSRAAQGNFRAQKE